MPAAVRPSFEPGRVYRTKELRRWGRNPTRLAQRLTRAGVLRELRHGLYVHPEQSEWGPLPPHDSELMRAFLEDAPFLFTGSQRWNALGLGATAVFAVPLVYNTKRSGDFMFGRRRFKLRRKPFPADPPPEWAVVDLIEHHEMAGVGLATIEPELARAVREARFSLAQLRAMAREYGTQATLTLIERSVVAATAVPDTPTLGTPTVRHTT